jgi:hypothetical protein
MDGRSREANHPKSRVVRLGPDRPPISQSSITRSCSHCRGLCLLTMSWRSPSQPWQLPGRVAQLPLRLPYEQVQLEPLQARSFATADGELKNLQSDRRERSLLGL